MDYFFTEEQKQIHGLARRIADEKIVPVRAELDETEDLPLGDHACLCRCRALRREHP